MRHKFQGWCTKWADCITPAVHSPHRFESGDKISTGPHLGGLASSPLSSRGSPTRHSVRVGDKISGGPQMGRLATSRLQSGGCPTLHSRGRNTNWPKSGRIGYVTPAIRGVPNTSHQVTKPVVAHKWAIWLCHPCRMGGPKYSRRGDKIRSRPQWCELAPSPLPQRVSAGNTVESGSQLGRLATSSLPFGGPVGNPPPEVAGEV